MPISSTTQPQPTTRAHDIRLRANDGSPPTHRNSNTKPTPEPQSRWSRKTRSLTTGSSSSSKSSYTNTETLSRSTRLVEHERKNCGKHRKDTRDPRRETAKHATERQSSSTRGGASTSQKHNTQDQESRELPSRTSSSDCKLLQSSSSHTHMIIGRDFNAQDGAHGEPNATSDEREHNAEHHSLLAHHLCSFAFSCTTHQHRLQTSFVALSFSPYICCC